MLDEQDPIQDVDEALSVIQGPSMRQRVLGKEKTVSMRDRVLRVQEPRKGLGDRFRELAEGSTVADEIRLRKEQFGLGGIPDITPLGLLNQIPGVNIPGPLDALAEVLPAQITPIAAASEDTREYEDIHARAQRGTDEDLIFIANWMKENEKKGDIPYQAADIVLGSIPFIGEILMTGPATAAIKKGGKKLLLRQVREAVENAVQKKARGAMAKRVTARIADMAVDATVRASLIEGVSQGTFGTGRMEANTWQRALPQFEMTEKDGQRMAVVVPGTQEEFWDVAHRGFFDGVIEQFSEQFGATLSRKFFRATPRGVSRGSKILDDILDRGTKEGATDAVDASKILFTKAQWLQGRFLADYAKKTGLSIQKVMDMALTKGFYNGPVAEWYEERVGAAIRELSLKDEKELRERTGTGFLDAVFPDMEQGIAEMIAFSVPFVAQQSLHQLTKPKEQPGLEQFVQEAASAESSPQSQSDAAGDGNAADAVEPQAAQGPVPTSITDLEAREREIADARKEAMQRSRDAEDAGDDAAWENAQDDLERLTIDRLKAERDTLEAVMRAHPTVVGPERAAARLAEMAAEIRKLEQAQAEAPAPDQQPQEQPAEAVASADLVPIAPYLAPLGTAAALNELSEKLERPVRAVEPLFDWQRELAAQQEEIGARLVMVDGETPLELPAAYPAQGLMLLDVRAAPGIGLGTARSVIDHERVHHAAAVAPDIYRKAHAAVKERHPGLLAAAVERYEADYEAATGAVPEIDDRDQEGLGLMSEELTALLHFGSTPEGLARLKEVQRKGDPADRTLFEALIDLLQDLLNKIPGVDLDSRQARALKKLRAELVNIYGGVPVSAETVDIATVLAEAMDELRGTPAPTGTDPTPMVTDFPREAYLPREPESDSTRQAEPKPAAEPELEPAPPPEPSDTPENATPDESPQLRRSHDDRPDVMAGVTRPETPQPAPSPPSATPKPGLSPRVHPDDEAVPIFATAIAEALASGAKLNIVAARKIYTVVMGKPAPTKGAAAKELDEMIELGVVLEARRLIRTATPGQEFRRIMEEPVDWHEGLPYREGVASFTVAIRSQFDPERLSRKELHAQGKGFGAWRTDLGGLPSEWSEKIQELLSDGQSRTFNGIVLELTGRTHTADNALGKAPEKGLWAAVEAGALVWSNQEEPGGGGVVRFASTTAEPTPGEDPNPDEETYDLLVDLYERQPKLSARTSTSQQRQAFSTPVPIGFLASKLAGIQRGTGHVYEPTAGNGALLLDTEPNQVRVNELDPLRASQLRAQGFEVTELDAVELAHRPSDNVIANPPFGKLKDEAGKPRKFQTPNILVTSELDHAIALQALASMKPDGRAVLIIGGKKGMGHAPDAQRKRSYNSVASRGFFKALYGAYNVTDHFTIDGKLYDRQGAAWPIDVIVINGTGKTEGRAFPGIELPPTFDSFEALKEKLPDADQDAASLGTEGTGKPVRGDAAEGEGRPEPDAVPEPVPDTGGEDAGEPGGGRDAEDDAGGTGVGQPGVSDGVEPEPDGSSGVPSEPGSSTRSPDSDAGGADVAGETGTAEPGSDSVSEDAEPGSVPGNSDSEGSKPVEERATQPRKAELAVNEFQTRYTPASKGGAFGTLVPSNMASAVADALDAIEARVGNIDEWVAGKMEWTVEEMLGKGDVRGYLAAEQVDALAMGLDNLERGAGFIIGDQTGVGKGRVVASLLHYAKLLGKVPIFFTQKPSLYAAMYEDFEDIGVKNFKALPTNATFKVPLGKPGPKQKSFRNLTPAKRLAAFAEMQKTGALPEGYDALFTTYDQTNYLGEDKAPDRHALLDALAPNAIIVLDESHEAGGSGDPKKKNRAQFIRALLEKSDGAVFSSATYAKNPQVMTLYAKTGLAVALDKPDDIVEVMTKGGVPMQQVVANMYIASGQYVRRERSFEGVEIDAAEAVISGTTSEAISSSLRSVFQFDLKMDEARFDFEGKANEGGGSVAADAGTGNKGASTNGFASVMHNVITQALLAAKAPAIVKEAVASHKRGEKPVIALSSTFGALLDDYVTANSLKNGDRIDGLNFNRVFARYLERTREVLILDPVTEEATRHYITDAELVEMGHPDLPEQYRKAREFIAHADLADLPGSPLDFIVARLEEAGLNVGEITGRSQVVKWDEGGGVLEARDSKTAAKKNTINGFNNGGFDVLLINKSGATGESMHASEKFDDQRRRNMILAQADNNVDTVMQMFGRVHRTGQVVAPKYTLLFTDMPAEKRPAANLMRKLQSLNASTTANAKGAFSFDTVDFLNKYGDEIVSDILRDDPLLAKRLDMVPKKKKRNARPVEGEDSKAPPNLASKATGRFALLEPEQQEALYTLIDENYKALIDTLNSLGQNTLAVKVLELDAKVVSSRAVTPSVGSGSLFGAEANLEVLDVKRLRKPLTGEQVQARILSDLRVATEDEGRAKAAATRETFLQDIAAEKEAAMPEAVEAHAQAVKKLQALQDSLPEKPSKVQHKALNAAVTREAQRAAAIVRIEAAEEDISSYLRGFEPGKASLITMNNERLSGFVGLVRRKGKKVKNPLAYSNYEVAIYTTESKVPVKIPFSQIKSGRYSLLPGDHNQVMRAFDDAAREGRERRFMVTGNLVAGFAKFEGNGQVVLFKDHSGKTREGVLLKDKFDAEGHLKKLPVRLNPAQSVKFLDIAGHLGLVSSEDGIVTIKKAGTGYEVITSNRGSKPYRFSPEAKKALGEEFTQIRGGKAWGLLAPLDAAKLRKLLRVWEKNLGASFETKVSLEDARKITGAKFAVNRSSDLNRPERLFEVFDIEPETGLQHFYRLFADSNERIKQYVKQLAEQAGIVTETSDVYGATELFPGRAGAGLRRFRDKRILPLIRHLSENGISLDQAADYVYARHAPERNELMARRRPKKFGDTEESPGSGMSDSEAQAITLKAEGGPSGDAYQQLGQMYDQITRETREHQLSEGLISQEESDAWEEMFEHYAPLRTDIEGRHSGTGGGYAVKGRESKRAKGRSSLADSPLLFALEQAENAIVRGEKNRVGLSFLELLRDNPSRALWSEELDEEGTTVNDAGIPVRKGHDPKRRLAKTVFPVKENGRQVLVTLSDPLMAKALLNLGNNNTGIGVRFLTRINRYLAQINTSMNPEFMLSNFVRDLQTALVHLAGEERAGVEAFKLARRTVNPLNLGAAIKAAHRGIRDKPIDGEMDTWYREYEDQGAKTDWFYTPTIEERQKELGRLLSHANPTGMAHLSRITHAAFGVVSDANHAVENGVRLSAYIQARKQGVSKKAAARLAKNLTVNFNRRGELGQLANALYLFANASIQGTTRMLHALRHPGVQKIATAITAASMALDIVNRLIAGDDDDGENFYDKIPEHIKARNLIIMDWDGSGNAFMLPLPYGYNVFHSIGQNLAAVMRGGKAKAAALRDIASVAWESFNPIGSEATIAQMIAPTFADPFVQVSENKTFYGSPITKENFPFGVPKPDSQLFWPSVSPLARELAESANSVTGGDTVQPGWLDVSPETLEHHFEFWTGGVGKLINRIGKTAQGGLDTPVRDVPFLRRVFREPDEFFVRHKFRDNGLRLDIIRERIEVRQEERDQDGARMLLRENKDLLRMEGALKDARKQIKRLLRGPEGARREEAIDRVQRRFNKRFKEAEETDA